MMKSFLQKKGMCKMAQYRHRLREDATPVYEQKCGWVANGFTRNFNNLPRCA